MEWTYLAHATGDNVHFEKVGNTQHELAFSLRRSQGNQIIETLAAAMEERKGGMFPTTWNLNMGLPASEARSMGAAADSGHEYLLKQYLLTGKDDLANLEMCTCVQPATALRASPLIPYTQTCSRRTTC